MKGGLLTGLYALGALTRAVGELPFERLWFVANPDEEIGSPTSTPIIRELAGGVDAAFVFECARANGDIVSSRKGIVDARITIHGRAAHAGVEPEKGRSAILAAAHLVPALHALTGRWPGVTCNVGVIHARDASERGGRGGPPGGGPAGDPGRGPRRGRGGRPGADGGTRRAGRDDGHGDDGVAGGRWRSSSGRGGSSTRAVALAERLGFPLRDAATGGASDANTTSGMGIPSLDGLGPIGGNDHAPGEYLEVDSIVPRTTLAAALLLAVARDPVVGSWRAG